MAEIAATKRPETLMWSSSLSVPWGNEARQSRYGVNPPSIEGAYVHVTSTACYRPSASGIKAVLRWIPIIVAFGLAIEA
jgi:hypothetical protein